MVSPKEARRSASTKRWRVLDLFSGAGGMSYGFHAHPSFELVGAVDLEQGKPSYGPGALECNSTYSLNIGITPLAADVRTLSPGKLKDYLRATSGSTNVDVLISCAPCTGFSRVVRRNLVEDDHRNSLVSRSADFVELLRPKIFLMENVGELLEGKFSHHFKLLRNRLEGLGYSVHGEVHWLSEFGVPQARRRALIVAVKRPLELHTLEELWDGYSVDRNAVTVRRAISGLPRLQAGEADPDDPCHISPRMEGATLQRLQMIPKDGGSWPDIVNIPGGWELLIPSMKRYASVGKVGPHPDVYGRLAWDRPAATVKRECSHTGNGRYAHPEQDRLCTVRELAVLQGFPRHYRFAAGALSNMYRHVGDAVPPIVSFQIAHLAQWILCGQKPGIGEVLLPDTHLGPNDVVSTRSQGRQLELAGVSLTSRNVEGTTQVA